LTLNNVTLGSLTSDKFVFNAAPPTGAVPTGMTLSANTIAEGSATATVIGTLAAIDNIDANETFTYNLVDSAGGLFAINGDKLVVNGTLNYETATSYQVTVQVTDSGNQTYNKTFTVNVSNLGATTLTDSNAANNAVAEGAAAGTVVGVTAIANDPGGGPLTYSLVDNAGGRFQINATTGVVTVLNGGLIDYETATSHTIVVRATDGTNAIEQNFTVNVTNINGVNQTGNTNNNTMTGTAENDTLNGSGGNDTLAGLGSGDVLIGGSGTDTATYAASAAGVDVSLTTGLGFGGDAAGDTLQTIENLIGSGQNDTLEGSSAANNLNGGGGIDTLTYKNAGAAVTVSLASTSAQSTGGAGSDTVSNFENLTGSAFNDTLTGSTGANVLKGLAGNDTINGGNGNDSLDGGIGTDTMTGGGNDDTFIFAAGYGADRITDFNVASSAEKIDLTGFEEIYSLADIAASQSGSNVVLNFGNGDTLTLNNVTLGSLTDADFVFNPEPVKSGAVPTDITLSNDTVNEGSATGTVIGSLLGIDNTDGGETFTYKLRDSAGGLFAISGSNLVVNGTLNYETATSYDIVVRVTDSGNQTYDKTFTIDLTNLGATALTDGNNAANSVAEGAATGATVGVTGLANDPGGGPLTYSLLDDAGGRFQINATTGVVTVLNGSLLDYETATSHTVTIQATDGTYAVDEDFVVNLTNVNGVTRTGNDNNNTLTGTGESDTLNGGKGNDTLTGLGGPDNLTGGNGADIFLFNFANEGVDTITDFKVGGADKIRVSASGFGGGLVAGATVSLTTTGDFAGAFSAGSNGYFIFDNAGADSGVYWDPTGGDSTDAVLFVKLSGVTSLLPSDFHVV
jgi:Ca2+-binding RTX toxin-like protein